MAFVVLLLGMGATVTMYLVSSELVYHEARLRFDNDTSDVEQRVAMRVRLYSDVLVTMQALFGAKDEVARGEFRDFVDGLDLPGRYPGFQTLNYAPYVRGADIGAFVSRLRGDPLLKKAGVDFAIRPPGERPAYYVLSYVEPLTQNLPSLGIDMGADTRRLAALERSRDTGEAISSGRLIFIDGGAQHVGLALRMPVYRRGLPLATVEERRRAYLGSVGAGIRVSDLMADLLGQETLRLIQFRIYDAGSFRVKVVPPSPATLLYDSVGGVSTATGGQHGAAGASGLARFMAAHVKSADAVSAIASDNPHLERSIVQSFGGRRWLIVFKADPMALSGPQRFLPGLTFVVGSIITMLLSCLAYALSTSRVRAVKLANQITFTLRESERARAEAQRIAHLGDWRVDLDHGVIHLSNEMARLIGWRGGKATGKALLRAIEPADRAALFAQAKRTLGSGSAFEFECRYRSRRGRRGWLRVIGHAYGPTEQRTLRGTALEITRQKAAERVRELEHAITLQLATATNEIEVFQQLVASLAQGMGWEAGAFWPTRAGLKQSLRSTYAAPCAELEPWLAVRSPFAPDSDELPDVPSWYGGNEVSGLAQARWLAEAGILTVFSFALRTGSVVLGVAEFYARERRHADPHALAMARSIASQLSHFLQRRQAEDNLHFIATHDALTGLPNRLMFKERLDDALLHAREDGTTLHVLFIDLDRFKDINDSLGHNVGDQLLRAVADRLLGEVKDAEMIARLGGDEFTVLVKQRDQHENVLRTIEEIQAALARPVVVSDMQLQVSASIGISSFPDDGDDAQTLLKHADIAMYGAKQRGKNTYQLYMRQMSMSLQRRVEMEAHLRQAIENREFTLRYQPRVCLATNQCTGVEALLRWQSPALGLVMPSDFIPLAEETGVIVPLGAWVLREACRQSAEWLAAGGGQIRVAVNLSAGQFASPDLLDHILEALDEAHLPGDFLELELTESMVMRQPEQAARWLSSLKQTGVRLSIDDFGTGYSSLAYLTRFPIDLVKIDRSFIRDIPDSRGDAQITSAVIALGHSLGLKVIAEGAETQAQVDFLCNEGCDEVQGYFFSRPIPASEVGSFVSRRQDAVTAEKRRPATLRVVDMSRERAYHT
ncbi:bifunctional diguanylate cyclase/phosphodiesterase [Trinickia terrae]|uniref:bifunctional diguanylate cyclase/phosphodiesterase n=1 Tax=Trinickia terrae TaxID=2571161 RepID=UPI001F118EA5|nr:EAL domain-containing protein [Trinickia terrae]